VRGKSVLRGIVRSTKEIAMKPRDAVLSVILALGLLAAPLVADAQQSGKVFRIGYLSAGLAPTDKTPQGCPIKGDPLWQAWVEGLRERGYIQGQNLVIECRWTEGRDERGAALAAEVVSLNPDLLVAYGTAQVRAAKQATGTLPIVMVGVINPVGRGLVASLARPGGNVTGLADAAGPDIAGKLLQLLKEAVPTAARVAVLGYSSGEATYQSDLQAAAQALGVTLQSYGVRAPEELEGAFTAMTKTEAEALLVQPHPFIGAHIQKIVDLAAQSRLPAVYPFRSAVNAGGLMAYQTNQPDIYRRLSFYVDKIFNGAKPGDLPVEQPTKFDLVINLQTAKTLGLTIPQSLLSRADKVIE
jgi:putative ABC transport system substrate-binding protein